jgi:acylphosphatase
MIRRAVIRGRVQGVGYRAWVEREALRYDLEGWVRNRRDGTVEAVFSGPEQDVDTMLAACRRGPRGAHVEALDVTEGSTEAMALRRSGERFSVLFTA